MQTGIANPDPVAYLRQAAEIDARESASSGGDTHPETFVRARALELWWQGADDLDRWIDARLHGPLALDGLDLPGQLRLQGLVRLLAPTPLLLDRETMARVEGELRWLETKGRTPYRAVAHCLCAY